MTRPRMQSMIRCGGELVGATMPERAIVMALPAVLERQFDPRLAAGLEAVFELRVGERRFAVSIAGGHCTVTPGAAPDAGAAVSISADDLVRLGAGVEGWPELLSQRRMQLTGDPFLGLRFPALFGLRAAVRPPRSPRPARD